MLLTELAKEYNEVKLSLDIARDFREMAASLVEHFVKNYTALSCNYYTSNSNSPKEGLANDLNEATFIFFNSVGKLNSFSRDLYKCIGALSRINISNKKLSHNVKQLIESADCAYECMCEIIENQLKEARKNTIWAELIFSLNKFIMNYNHIVELNDHIGNLDELLIEPLPEQAGDISEYNRIELRSLKPLSDLSSFAEDLSLLDSFITQFELLKSSDSGSSQIYTQRIESGSLRIVWGSHTIELSSISDIIKALSDGIRMFRLTPAEKRLQEEQTRELKIENDTKELAIINSQITNIIQYMGLSTDNPEDKEKIQQLCLPLVRYLYNNPVGIIGDYKYDINNDLKLLGTFYDKQQ